MTTKDAASIVKALAVFTSGLTLVAWQEGWLKSLFAQSSGLLQYALTPQQYVPNFFSAVGAALLIAGALMIGMQIRWHALKWRGIAPC